MNRKKQTTTTYLALVGANNTMQCPYLEIDETTSEYKIRMLTTFGFDYPLRWISLSFPGGSSLF
jgi:hypothetical protein